MVSKETIKKKIAKTDSLIRNEIKKAKVKEIKEERKAYATANRILRSALSRMKADKTVPADIKARLVLKYKFTINSNIKKSRALNKK